MHIDYKKKSANNCLGQARLLIKIITMIINCSFFSFAGFVCRMFSPVNIFVNIK